MEFIGKAYLLDVSTYKGQRSKDDGTVVEKQKYTFLVGDQDDPHSFMENPHVETYISEKPVLEEIGFMLEIVVAVSIRTFPKKVNGAYTEVTMPVYRVVGNVEE